MLKFSEFYMVFFINIWNFFYAGVLGIKVKIMLRCDPNGKTGPKKPLPDCVEVPDPKEEIIPVITSEVKSVKMEMISAVA